MIRVKFKNQHNIECSMCVETKSKENAESIIKFLYGKVHIVSMEGFEVRALGNEVKNGLKNGFKNEVKDGPK